MIQDRQGGTGHAVRTVLEAVGPIAGQVIVTYGECRCCARPHWPPGRRARGRGQHGDGADREGRDPAGYGRIIRDASGAITEIVEEAEATDEQRLVGRDQLRLLRLRRRHCSRTRIKRIATSNVLGQEYLTDVVAILRGDGHRVGTQLAADASEIQGVNDRVQLAQARRIYNDRLLEHWMRAGVTIVDPATTWLDVDVTLEPDAEIGPSTQLEGRTTIASGARVGPGCVLRDTVVGAGATVINAVCDSAEIGPEASVGPYTRLRPGTRLGPGTRAGSFVEMKNAVVGEGSKVPHLTYVGDADIGYRFEHRGCHGVRELRRRGQAPHHRGRPRPDRERHHACRAGRDRRRRLHRRRVRHYRRTSRRERWASAAPGSATCRDGWAGAGREPRPPRPLRRRDEPEAAETKRTQPGEEAE